MTAHEIQIILKKLEEIESKFESHRECATQHWERTNSFIDEMRPILEAQRTIVYFHKFLSWGGLTIAGAIALLYLLFNKLR